MNFVVSQICWFCCVLGGAHGVLWIGPVATTLFCAWVVKSAEKPRLEAKFLLLAALAGSLGDRFVVASGAYEFTQAFWAPWGYPIWMTSLWLAFAATFNHSLKFLQGKYLGAFLFGVIGGPLAYSAGAALGAIEFGQPVFTSKLIVAGYWGLILPLLFYIRRSLKP